MGFYRGGGLPVIINLHVYRMELQDIPETAVTLMATLTFVFGGITAGLISSVCLVKRDCSWEWVCGICLFAFCELASLMVYGGDFGIAALTKLLPFFLPVLLAESWS
jgi:hypothetical protein